MKMLICVIVAIVIGNWYENKVKSQPIPIPAPKYVLAMETSGSHIRIYQVPQ